MRHASNYLSLAAAAGLLVVLGGPCRAQHGTAAASASGPLTHVQNSFELVVHAPYPDAARLFGPEGERPWSDDGWNPQFLYPRPARDAQGAVFRVEHGGHTSVWVNTLMSISQRHFQYVYFIPGALVTTIDVRFLPLGSGNTRVFVTYLRTALTAAANEHVEELGERDKLNGPEWERQVNSYLSKKAPDHK